MKTIMNIGIEIDDRRYSSREILEPREGNPGMGGTEYVLLLLAWELSYLEGYSVTLFHFNKDIKFPARLKTEILDENDKNLEVIQHNGIEVYILTSDNKSDEWYSFFNDHKIKVLIHLDNYPQKKRIGVFESNPCVSRYVFLGGEEYDRYIDDDMIKKGAIIENLHYPIKQWNRTPASQKDNIVVYTGAIVPQKGFHILARQWKDIVKAVPDAKLYVLGSGTLYGDTDDIGPYGIAKKDYEERFMPYLIEDGKLLDSVCFLGTVGAKKRDEILLKAKVGVVNPSGQTEVFCGSAIEMSMVGLPVVTYAGYGQYDVVKDGQTGFLIKNETQLRDRIVSLLKSNSLNEELGINGIEFVKQFETDIIIPKWIQLFEGLNQKELPYLGWHGKITSNKKWFNVINRFLRIKLGLKFLKSRMRR